MAATKSLPFLYEESNIARELEEIVKKQEAEKYASLLSSLKFNVKSAKGIFVKFPLTHYKHGITICESGNDVPEYTKDELGRLV